MMYIMYIWFVPIIIYMPFLTHVLIYVLVTYHVIFYLNNASVYMTQTDIN